VCHTRFVADRVERAQTSVGRGDRTIESRVTVHVLRRVLEHSVSDRMVVEVVDRHRLESPPPEGEDERVVRLKRLGEPSVSLDPDGSDSSWKTSHAR
jgi:hypothetical protein